jgi:hypothetical protein
MNHDSCDFMDGMKVIYDALHPAMEEQEMLLAASQSYPRQKRRPTLTTRRSFDDGRQ